MDATDTDVVPPTDRTVLAALAKQCEDAPGMVYMIFNMEFLEGQLCVWWGSHVGGPLTGAIPVLFLDGGRFSSVEEAMAWTKRTKTLFLEDGWVSVLNEDGDH